MNQIDESMDVIGMWMLEMCMNGLKITMFDIPQHQQMEVHMSLLMDVIEHMV